MASPAADDQAAALARRILEVLKDRRPLPPNVPRELEKQTKNLKTATSISSLRDYDTLGTELWNSAAASLDERVEDSHDRAAVRVFALLLLERAHHTRHAKKKDQTCRILKTGLRTARLCLELSDIDLAQTVFEQIAPYIPTTSDEQPLMQISGPEKQCRNKDGDTLRTLTAEYHLLRLMCEWKRGRIDVAEVFYNKINLNTSSTNLRFKAADLFLEIGKSFSGIGNEHAANWLDRAFTALAEHDLESQENAELFLNIAITYVDEALQSNSDHERRRAYEMVDRLERCQQFDNRITVAIAKFKVLASSRPAETGELSSALSRIVTLAVLTDSNFQMVMQTLSKASKISVSSTLGALKCFIVERLLVGLQETRVWLEKAAVAYVLFTTSNPHDLFDAPIDDLQDLLDSISAKSGLRFSAKAMHAIQTLLWKAGWNSLLCHSVFENAGPINKARIGRRLIRNALEQDQPEAAMQSFINMPKPAQNEPATRFLAFKLALRLNDEDLAMSSLAAVAKSAKNDPTYLYACVLAAGQSQTHRFSIVALQALLDQRPNGIYLPALLRCTARLLLMEVDAGQNAEMVAQETLRVFEAAARNTDEIRQLPNERWRSEIQWWSKNAYNIAVKLCAQVNPEYVLRMLEVCTKFMDCYPNDPGLMLQDGLEKRRLTCSFLSATALIVLGRASEEPSDYFTQCFSRAQQHMRSFKSSYAKLSNSLQDPKSQEQAFNVLKFEIECILRLQQWDKLGPALQACMKATHVGRWDTLADLLIIVHQELDETTVDSHAEMLTQLLQRIINDTWKKERDIAKVARWLRFTFDLCLESSQRDTASFSLKLLQQAGAMAESGSKGSKDPYPESELQWLATMSFNHAVDLLEHDSDEAMKWIEGALQLAKWSDDNGSLHAMLTRQKEKAIERMKDPQAA